MALPVLERPSRADLGGNPYIAFSEQNSLLYC